MPLPLQCSRCGKSYSVSERLSGQRVRCKACGAVLTVPQPTAPAAGGLSLADIATLEGPARGDPPPCGCTSRPPRPGAGVPRWVWLVGAAVAGLGVAAIVLILVLPRSPGRSAPAGPSADGAAAGAASAPAAAEPARAAAQVRTEGLDKLDSMHFRRENGRWGIDTQPDPATAPADPPMALKDQQLDLAALKDFGTRAYRVTILDTATGQRRLSAQPYYIAATAIEGDAVILTDTMPMMVAATFRRTCAKDAFLSLQSLDTNTGGTTHHIVVLAGRASAVADGQVYSAPLPAGTLSASAFLRLATLLPQTPGRRWSVPHFVPDFMNYAKSVERPAASAKPPGGAAAPAGRDRSQRYPAFVDDAVIQCVGPEVVTTSGKATPCTRFTVTAAGAIVGTVWVTPDHVPKQFQFDPTALCVLPD